MTITDFLDARIAEDEAVAYAAIAPSQMHPYGDESMPVTPVERWGDDVRGYLGGTWGEHCAQQNPVRTIAECAAKRKMLDNIPKMGDVYEILGGTSAYVLLCLASTYADHPDFNEGWAL